MKPITGSTLAGLAMLAITLACAGAAGGSTPMTKVTLQLKWVTQAQFGGYYAAKAKGYYAEAGLDVTINPGGPDIVPEQVVLDGKAQFGIDWLASLLAARERGGDIVNIAQVFARSATAEVVWKSSGITSFCQLRGRRVGLWPGNQFEQLAALKKCGIDPNAKGDVTIVSQPFSMEPLLQGKVDAVSADTFNELALLLETTNPKTGKLYQLSDLKIFKMQDQGTGMLEDGIFAKGSWLKSKKNQDVARRFIEASLKGWVWCRDHFRDCVNIVLQNGPTLGKGHQVWQMNEINALIWPAPQGIGLMEPAAFDRTAKIAEQFKVISKKPSGAWRSDLAKAAVADLKKQGVDATGAHWSKAIVQVTPGGR
jgi:NitT/TauT family transport system substrate-binding protein